MEIAAENTVGRSPKSHRQREESRQDPRSPGGRAMHPTHPGLPTHHRRGPRAVPPKPGDEEAGERMRNWKGKEGEE